jgi:hypothetical protein
MLSGGCLQTSIDLVLVTSLRFHPSFQEAVPALASISAAMLWWRWCTAQRGAPKQRSHDMKPAPESKLSKLRRNARSGGALRE